MSSPLQKFRAALAQYETIDRRKCERYSKIIHGFYVVKMEGDKIGLRPFMCCSDEDLKTVEQCILDEKEKFIGVSFAQKYIHYGTP